MADKFQRKASIVESHSSHEKREDRRQSGPGKTGAPRKSIHHGGRRQSISITSRKSSQDAAFQRVKLQNTYRVGPEEHEKFKAHKIEARLYEQLESMLKNEKYDAARSTALTKEISQEIMRETLNVMINSRYKFVSHVVIGEMKGKN